MWLVDGRGINPSKLLFFIYILLSRQGCKAKKFLCPLPLPLVTVFGLSEGIHGIVLEERLKSVCTSFISWDT